MKHLLLVALLVYTSLASTAQTAHPHRHSTTATRPTVATGPKVYVCSGGSAYAYHSSGSCAGLNRCTHVINAVTMAQAQSMGRQACRKCY